MSLSGISFVFISGKTSLFYISFLEHVLELLINSIKSIIVEAIDTKTNKVIATVPVKSANEIAVISDGTNVL